MTSSSANVSLPDRSRRLPHTKRASSPSVVDGAPVLGHAVDDVQRDQRHPRLEVQLAERRADDTRRRGQQLARVDHQDAARPGAEQLARRARGVIIHPALERTANAHRKKGPLANDGRDMARTLERLSDGAGRSSGIVSEVPPSSEQSPTVRTRQLHEF